MFLAAVVMIASITSSSSTSVEAFSCSPSLSGQNTLLSLGPLYSTHTSSSVIEGDGSRTEIEIQPKAAISMNIEELAERLGGRGRAKLVWDYMKIGVDPLVHFRGSSSTSSILDTFIQGVDDASNDDIQSLLPNTRRTQPLGKAALDMLQDMYADYGGKLEGGVVSLSDVSTSSDGTTKLLIRLHDGLEIETVIIPWFDKGWSTICIS